MTPFVYAIHVGRYIKYASVVISICLLNNVVCECMHRHLYAYNNRLFVAKAGIASVFVVVVVVVTASVIVIIIVVEVLTAHKLTHTNTNLLILRVFQSLSL